ncbi:nucleolar protein 8 [Rhineura floridana]|uniref:nucleolar protein 8 n=1 Tax=Rhineura floridana TaxID=261503 RepID=UPI002AC8045C|nr:nucleolar protein 8 [Rhineura floridana]XP_061474036.1 nucleolar protein 8 [Rhineura floridana]XP_061474037.1 nucleolar protein 8 [Rhineura floridana]XP_061474038.1 nucleolar protein 8 [Rhineura floridana]XP_061474039.1 nucleolar protein 8 [Rhineura floridana]
MEETPVVKRLYVGGLGHTISEAELQERFGKFGNVTETEIVTRKDEQGNPAKTFAYINITLSEKELKKCISVLNKTKWKGGTLQIELAKESFLHRLARERQEESIRKEKPDNNGMTNVLKSLKKSGITNFHVKAVPGTEVPNHKDWVVGKFGRVLPILHLKGQHRSKIIKYDPSKYCHNLKKLDQDFTETVPISQLTWHLEEGDDSMSKKRQGQFPVSKPPKKKMRVEESDNLRTELHSYGQFSSKARNVAPTKLVQSHTPKTNKQNKEHSVPQKHGTVLTPCRNINSLSESDIDSEEEIRAIIEREREVRKVNSNIEHEDNMEVVRDNFELKYCTHWSLQKVQDAKQAHTGCNGVLKSTDNNSDYDSADTDEIIAVTKVPNKKQKNEAPEGSNAARRGKDGRSKINATHSGSSDSDGLILDKQKREERAKPEKTSDSKAALQQDHVGNKCTSENNESSDSYLDTSESDGDEDYEAMMQSCYQLDLTLEDLERLASEKSKTTYEDNARNQSDMPYKTTKFPANSTSNIPKKSTDTITPKKCICPEEIVSAILEGESSDEDKPKRKKSNLKIQPFKGTGSLSKVLTKSELDTHDKVSSALVDLETLKSVSKPKSLSVQETTSDSLKRACIINSVENSDYSKPNAESSKVESNDVSVTSERKNSKSLKSLCKRTKTETGIKGSSFAHSKNMKGEEAFLDSAKATSMLDKKEKQLQDNEKRLAALQERQKERELQKKLVQGALTSLEIQSTRKQKHIVFDSDGENEPENDTEVQEGMKGRSSEKLLGKEFATKTSGKLFESSEDESDTADEEDDRFKIKLQFEGKAGEKLMHLQSRFGTDERFRMDARFLESDSEQEGESKKVNIDEEELTLEKKKNLEILKNLLNVCVELPKPSKQTANARKFKDMNTLRYDPTRQDHTVFERKPENANMESKAKKKKQREEAQKLPEVSKEIFYDVTLDLKEILGSVKCDEKAEVIPWDKHDDLEEATPTDTETLAFSAGNHSQEESSGFTFSFFGAEEERPPMKEEPYIIETIKPSRVAWQEDPRFQDSSSEDDEPEFERDDVKEMSPGPSHSNIRFFFFSRYDDRLKEGPKLFCKSSNLEEDTDYWESRRQTLLEDCRKKHKDARRKIKAKQ